MKRIVSLVVIVLMFAFLLTGCGNVKNTIAKEYDDGFAKSYAVNVTTDDDGNTSYEFTEEKYKEFLEDYDKKVRDELVDTKIVLQNSGQFMYFDSNGKELYLGIKPEYYEKKGEAALKKEAQKVGEYALKYTLSNKGSGDKITVVYLNANTSQEYFRVEVTAK